MRFLLDTTLLIDHAKGRPGVADLVASLFEASNDLLICDVVLAEALTGVDDDQRGVIAALARAIEYVATHPDAAIWAADSRRRRRATGARSLANAIIAGVAWSFGATIVTRNPRDFEVQGVPVLAYD